MNKKIKKIISITILCVSTILLVGCNDTTINKESNSRLIETGYYCEPLGYVYYDKVTNIVYLIDSYHGTSTTVLYNSDGTPMTLDEYNKTK